MTLRRATVALGSVLAILSCTRTPSTTAAPITTASRPGPGGPPTAPARRIPPSRDSLVKLRAVYVAQVMAQIAGREDQPAEQVFKNVQVLKGITAAALVQRWTKITRRR